MSPPPGPSAHAAATPVGPVAAAVRDAELVARLRRGDGAALDRAFALHKDRLFAFLVRLSGRRDLAEDLLQETFLQLARHALRLQPDTDLAGWLFTVARNAFRMAARRHHAGQRALDALPAPEPRAADDPERAAVASAGVVALRRALLELPEDHREVLLLAVEGELTTEQAASVLGIRADAFRKRLERARAELARRLLDGDALSSPSASASAASRGVAP